MRFELNKTTYEMPENFHRICAVRVQDRGIDEWYQLSIVDEPPDFSEEEIKKFGERPAFVWAAWRAGKPYINIFPTPKKTWQVQLYILKTELL